MTAEDSHREAPEPRTPRPGILARALAGAVRAYQLVISPWFAPTCRYFPSCSAYTIEALRTHGALKGLALGTWRLLRCNPFSSGGIDHVPARGSWPSAVDRLPRLLDGGASQGHDPHHAQGHQSEDDRSRSRDLRADVEPDQMLDHGTPTGAGGRTLGSRTSRRART